MAPRPRNVENYSSYRANWERNAAVVAGLAAIAGGVLIAVENNPIWDAVGVVDLLISAPIAAVMIMRAIGDYELSRKSGLRVVKRPLYPERLRKSLNNRRENLKK